MFADGTRKPIQRYVSVFNRSPKSTQPSILPNGGGAHGDRRAQAYSGDLGTEPPAVQGADGD